MKNLITTLILLFASQLLLAWGQNGHRIVAQICYDNLTEETRLEIDEMLGDDYLAQVANWPDFIKSEQNWNFAKPWHYVTIHSHQTVEEVITEGRKKPKIENAIEAIELMKAILKGEEAATKQFQNLMDENAVKPLSGSIKATALAFLVHIIGDIHQPLHCGKNKDHGGNKISVLFFNERSNIHAVWDSGIVEKEELSYTEFSAFIVKHTITRKAAWETADIISWVEESIIGREKIYNTIYDNTDRDTGLPNLSYSYQHDFLPMVEDRLAAAGYRAAVVLNDCF